MVTDLELEDLELRSLEKERRYTAYTTYDFDQTLARWLDDRGIKAVELIKAIYWANAKQDNNDIVRRSRAIYFELESTADILSSEAVRKIR